MQAWDGDLGLARSPEDTVLRYILLDRRRVSSSIGRAVNVRHDGGWIAFCASGADYNR